MFCDFNRLVEEGRVIPGNACYPYYCFDEPWVVPHPDIGGYWNCVFGQARGRDVFLSSELLFYASATTLGEIAAECERRGYRIVLVAYLRRQDRALIDSYLQNVRNQKFTGSVIEFLDRGRARRLLSYRERLDQIRAVLQPAETRVRIFEPRLLVGGDVWADLAATTVDVLAQAPRAPDGQTNPGLGLWGARLLRLLNAAEARGEIPGERAAVVRAAVLERASTFALRDEAKRDHYTDEVRSAVEAAFLAGNEDLCRSYFADWPDARAYWLDFARPTALARRFDDDAIEDLMATVLAIDVPRQPPGERTAALTSFAAAIDARPPVDQFRPGELVVIGATVWNLSPETWPVGGPRPVHVSYRWYREDGAVVVADGLRTRLSKAACPGEGQDVKVRIRCPDGEGRYLLRISLVQETVAWFHDQGSGFADIRVVVAHGAAGASPGSDVA